MLGREANLAARTAKWAETKDPALKGAASKLALVEAELHRAGMGDKDRQTVRGMSLNLWPVKYCMEGSMKWKSWQRTAFSEKSKAAISRRVESVVGSNSPVHRNRAMVEKKEGSSQQRNVRFHRFQRKCRMRLGIPVGVCAGYV